MAKQYKFEGINCDECMKEGKRFLLCCRAECGTHCYCEYCSLKDVYTAKQVDSDKQ